MEEKTPEVVENTTNQVEETTNKVEEKTFTQAELNEIVEQRLAKAKKGIPSKEELQEYNAWKESQKTAEEKENDKDKEITRLKQENLELKNMSHISNAGIDKKFQKFVLSEVSQLEGEFEDNLTNYIKENQQYLVHKEEPKVTTGFSQNGTNNSVSEEKQYLDEKYAKNPFYKK